MADGEALVDKVLEVLGLCPEQVQRQLIGFLPEIAAEADHEVRCEGWDFGCRVWG